MPQKSYSGRFKPSNPGKYKGDPTNIIYRSLWERKLMVWCDNNEKVSEWGSEETIIPYVSPVDNRVHRYFPDFYVRARTRNEGLRSSLSRLNRSRRQLPPKKKSRVTKRYLSEVTTYAVNDAKWKAAREYCADRQMKFLILTEKELLV